VYRFVVADVTCKMSPMVAVAIAQHRKILIVVDVTRLIKYLKVEEFIREIVQRK